MFQGLFKRAERSLDSVVAKLVGRATVAVPLLVAAGFATAAVTVKLVELHGAAAGYALMAVAYGIIGLATLAVVGIATRPAAEAQETPSAASAAGEGEAGDEAAPTLPPEVMAFLTSAAPAALPALVRGIGRNLPLVFILALIVFIVSRFAETSENLGATAAEGDMAAAPPPV